MEYRLADHEDLFAIDSITGNITTKQEFDTEKKDYYTVKVFATDIVPSSLTADGKPNIGKYNENFVSILVLFSSSVVK